MPLERMDDKINIQQFLDARSREIAEMERSLEKKNTRIAPFQQMAHYLRRRNHSFEFRAHKYKKRTKQRFVLKTHIYFAKRFSMLKIIEQESCLKQYSRVSIPWIRNVKSNALINKAYCIGYFIDEGIRKVETFSSLKDVSDSVDQTAWNQLRNLEYQSINTSEYAKMDDNLIKMSFTTNIEEMGTHSLFKLYSVKKDHFKQIKEAAEKHGARLLKNRQNQLDDYIIIGERSSTMNLMKSLQKLCLRLISINELETVALERDSMTIYDNISSSLFKAIDTKINVEIVAKFNRTPPSKRVAYDLTKLQLHQNQPVKYFVFKMPKGRANRSSEILSNNETVGGVIRAGFKLKGGAVFGLGFVQNNVCLNTPLTIRILSHPKQNPLVVVKDFN